MTIIVPYRDRERHLDKFVNAITSYLPNAKILVVEQTNEKPFNRAKLLNIGFLETKDDFFVMHDVDMIPKSVDYSEKIGVTQLASSDIQKWDYLGGVTMFDKVTFERIGGYHNDYFHRAEDNEMMFRIKRIGVRVNQRHGIFYTLEHERKSPEFIPWLWAKAQMKRFIANQLSVCTYKVIERHTFYLFDKITVQI